MEPLSEKNNQLREKLTRENRKYYENLLLYLRIKGKDELVTEAVLLEILQDMLEAQANGRSAQQYFGADPKAAADELVTEINDAKQANLKENLSLNVFIFCLLTLLAFTHTEINVIAYMIEIVGMVILLNVTLTLLAIDAFKRVSWQSYLGVGVAFMVYVGVLLLSDYFTPKTLIYPLGPATLWGIGALFVIYLVLYFKWNDHFSSGLFYIGALAFAATLVHLPLTGNIFQTLWGQVSLLVMLALLLTVKAFKFKK